MTKQPQPITTVTLPDGLEVTIESFLVEPSRDPKLAADGFKQSTDELVAAPLLKIQRSWSDWPEPHLVLPLKVMEQEVPEHVVTAWCRFGGDDRLVLVFFTTVDDSLSMKEFFQLHLEDIHLKVLINIQKEAERDEEKWFGWLEGESCF